MSFGIFVQHLTHYGHLKNNNKNGFICSFRNMPWKIPCLRPELTMPLGCRIYKSSSPNVRKNWVSSVMMSGAKATSTRFFLGSKPAWRERFPLTSCCWREGLMSKAKSGWSEQSRHVHVIYVFVFTQVWNCARGRIFAADIFYWINCMFGIKLNKNAYHVFDPTKILASCHILRPSQLQHHSNTTKTHNKNQSFYVYRP